MDCRPGIGPFSGDMSSILRPGVSWGSQDMAGRRHGTRYSPWKVRFRGWVMVVQASEDIIMATTDSSRNNPLTYIHVTTRTFLIPRLANIPVYDGTLSPV